MYVICIPHELTTCDDHMWGVLWTAWNWADSVDDLSSTLIPTCRTLIAPSPGVRDHPRGIAVPHALKGHPDHVQSNISVKPSRQTTPNSKRNLLNIIELQSSQDASLDKWLCNDMNEYQNRFDHKPVYTPNPGAARSSAFSKYRTTKEGNEATNECCSLRSWAYGNLTGKYRRTST